VVKTQSGGKCVDRKSCNKVTRTLK